ncbi:MAG: VOC family protein [Saprospiraceae bacterium]
MLTVIHPKLPMRDKTIAREYYIDKLGFRELGGVHDFPEYLMLEKDSIELHFFLFKDLNPLENYGQVYIRTDNIEEWYQLAKRLNLRFAEFGIIGNKPWMQREFSITDPDINLLTFGQSLI